ncbi:MAG: FkbM family methyltransferase [Candidatus Marinimicrobia bacterium]|nr:FkbM family methyltransferase [Candidatus Neomarinimicrobiota bacterium]
MLRTIFNKILSSGVKGEPQKFIADMNCWVMGRRLIDFVDFDDIKLFMYKNDNIYDNFIDDRRKNYPLREFLRGVREKGYPRPEINRDTISAIQSCRHLIYLIMKHLWDVGEEFTVLDVGCHVGLFGLKLASVIREFGKDNEVICFDIGEASELMPYNIKVNGLEKWVTFEKLAISDVSGPAIVYARQGHTDTNNIIWKLDDSYSYLAEGITISEYIKEHKLSGPFMIKLDVEGLEFEIIEEIKSLIDSDIVVLIFEFSSERVRDKDFFYSIFGYLFRNYYLFDIYYVLSPSMAVPICEADENSFFKDVLQRPYRYTDVLGIPKKLDGVKRLGEGLESLETLERTYKI